MVKKGFFVQNQVKNIISDALIIAIILEFINKDISFINHPTLPIKVDIYRKGQLPLRLVKLFKKATANNILESDGGSWRFRHRALQDYFAKYWEENYKGKEGSP